MWSKDLEEIICPKVHGILCFKTENYYSRSVWSLHRVRWWREKLQERWCLSNTILITAGKQQRLVHTIHWLSSSAGVQVFLFTKKSRVMLHIQVHTLHTMHRNPNKSSMNYSYSDFFIFSIFQYLSSSSWSISIVKMHTHTMP